jgi:hypothetical protein
VKAIIGIEYIRGLSVDKLAKVLIRSCPSDIGLKNLDQCPIVKCTICWINALESEVDEEAIRCLIQVYEDI